MPKDKDKPTKKIPPFILFKGAKLLELGFQEAWEEMGGAEGMLDIKIFLGDGENGGEEGKWYIELLDTDTGENCGTYNDAHCPDPLNPECE